jgi:hypothetical protein
VRWRLRITPAPGSVLFPVPDQGTEIAPIISVVVNDVGFSGRVTPYAHYGRLLVDGFRPEPPDRAGVRAWPLRLLLPELDGAATHWRVWAPEGGHTLAVRVNGTRSGAIAVPPGWSESAFATHGPGWRPGWNLIELTSSRPDAALTLEWLEMNVRPGGGSE